MRTLPRIPRLLPGLAVGILLVGVLAGCGPHIQCGGFSRGDDCERIAEAAIPEVPAGATSVIVDSGASSGIRTPPYPILACYPDGTVVAVGVTLTADGADVVPWTEELPFACP